MIGFFCVAVLAAVAILLAIVLTGNDGNSSGGGTESSSTTTGDQVTDADRLARDMVDILNNGDLDAVEAVACGQPQAQDLMLKVSGLAEVGVVVGAGEQVDKDTARTELNFADPARQPRPSLIMTMKTRPNGTWCVESLDAPR